MTKFLTRFISLLWSNKLIVLMVGLFAFLSLSFVLPNGNFDCRGGVCGLWIGQWHKHDYIWHMALVKMAFASFPLTHPNYSGAILEGYNYFLDLPVLLLTKFGISSLTSLFKILPIVFVPIYIYLVIKLGTKIENTRMYLYSFLFFMLFGSSFSYLISLYRSSSLYYATLVGFPVVTSIQPGTIFLNLQFAYSLLCVLTILLILKSNANSYKTSIYLGLLTFLALSLKFYGGVIAALLIGIYYLLLAFKSKSFGIFARNTIFTFLFSIASILIFYNPQNVTSASGFAYDPFAITHHMIEDNNLFRNDYLTFARYFLYENGISPRLVAIEIYSLLLFLGVNFGTRLIALYAVIKKIVDNRFNFFDASVIITIIISIIIPILFVQKGSFYNTMQFLYYGVALSSIYAASTLSDIFSSSKRWVLAGIALLILTIPNYIDQLRYVKEPQQVITNDELSALAFLELQPPGAIYASHAHKKDAYISAFSGKQTYFTDVDQLMVTFVDYKSREEVIRKPWLLQPERVNSRYWYLLKNDEDFEMIDVRIRSVGPYFSKIYENDSVLIYEKIKEWVPDENK